MNLGLFLWTCKKILQDPLRVLFLFILPIGATLLLGMFFEKGQSELSIPIAIVDEDQSDFSSVILNRLSKQSNIRLLVVPIKDAKKLLKTNEVDSVFVLKKGFQEKILEQNREGIIEEWVTPSTMAVGIIRELIASEVIRITSNIKAADKVVHLYEAKNIAEHPEQIWNMSFTFADNQWEPEPLMTIDYTHVAGKRETSNKSEKALFNPSIGLWTFFSMLSIFMSMSWMVREQQTVFTRIRTTAKGLASYLLPSIGAYWVMHSIQATFSYMIFVSLGIAESSLNMLCSMILFVFFALSLCIWMASYSKNLNHYYLVSILFVLFIGIAGGSFFPVQEISKHLQQIGFFLPHGLVLLYLTDFQRETQLIWAISLSLLLWVLSLRRFNTTNDSH